MCHHGYVRDVVWLQVIGDGMPQLVCTVSHTDWNDSAVRTISYLVLDYFLSSRGILLPPVL